MLVGTVRGDVISTGQNNVGNSISILTAMVGEHVGVKTDRNSIPAAFYFLLEVILPTQNSILFRLFFILCTLRQ